MRSRFWCTLALLAGGCSLAPLPPLPRPSQSSPPTRVVQSAPSPAPAAPPTPMPTVPPPGQWQPISVPNQAAASSGFPLLAVDGDPTTEWNPHVAVAPGAPQWLSVAIAPHGDGPLALVWHAHELHYLVYGDANPRSYTIAASDDSTDGTDGHWRTLASVTDNPVRSRVTLLDAPHARWLRLTFSDVWNTVQNYPFLREVSVYQAVQGSAPDTWAFFGDSITADAFDPAVANTFSPTVAARHPGYDPIVISAGTGGDTSADALGRLRVALPTLPRGSVIGLCYGANDASHGVSVADYRTHLEQAVDLVRAAGDQPVLAVLPWSLNGAIADYAQACRDVAQEKGLPPGPDFYSFFKAHPDEQNADHVHPDAQGVVDMQRLWAEAADFRY